MTDTAKPLEATRPVVETDCVVAPFLTQPNDFLE